MENFLISDEILTPEIVKPLRSQMHESINGDSHLLSRICRVPRKRGTGTDTLFRANGNRCWPLGRIVTSPRFRSADCFF